MRPEARSSGSLRSRPELAPVAAFAALGVFWGLWAALVPEAQRQTRATDPELGAALLWIGGGALPAMLATGRLWSRLGRRLLAVTLAAFAIVAPLPGLSRSPLELAVALAVVGAASGALDVAMNSAVGDLEATTGRRLMYGAHALFSAALLVGSFSAGILRSAGVTAAPILLVSSASFLVALGTGLLWGGIGLDRPNGRVERKPAVPARDDRADPGVLGGRGALLALGALCAAAFLIEDAMASWSALFLERELGSTAAVGAAGPGLFAGAMAAGRALGHVIGRWLADRQLVVASGLVTASGIAVTAVAPEAVVALVGLVIAGAGVSLTAPALFARAARMGGVAKRGAAVSTLTVLGYLGFVMGPPIVGSVAGAAGLRVSFGLLSVLAIVALGIGGAIVVRERATRVELDPALPPIGRA